MSNYWQGKGAGKRIAIRFNKPLLGDVTGNEMAFTIKGMVRNPLKYGPLTEKTFTVESVERYPIEQYWQDDFSGQMDGVEVGENGVVLGGDPFAWGWENHGAFATATQAADRTYGWVFTAQDNIAVTKLRLYPNVSREIKVDLWDSVTQLAVASANINATANQWNEITLETPVGLISGRQYRISIDYTGGESVVVRSHSSIQQSEFNPQIQYASGAFANAKNTYPASNSTTYAYGIADIGIGGIYGELGTYITTIPTATLPADPRLRFEANTPEDTSVTVEYACTDDDETPPESWTPVDDEDLLTIDDAYLWLRYTLETEDTSKTPTLLAVWLEEAEAPPDTILLTMAPDSRFNDVEGDITVSYERKKGTLTGNRPVEDFTRSFTPTGLEPTPLNVQGTITAGIEVAVDLIEVDPIEVDYVDLGHKNTITAGITVDVALIPVSVIPP